MHAEPWLDHEEALAAWYRQISAPALGGNANIYSTPVEEVVVQVEPPPSETLEVYVQHKEPKL